MLEWMQRGETDKFAQARFECHDGGKITALDKLHEYMGLVIVNAVLAENEFVIQFDDGSRLEFADHGRSCCEIRRMTSDDDPAILIGGMLISVEPRDMGSESGEYGSVHEQACIIIQGSRGFVTVTTHNEHNGYYGGFTLQVREFKNDLLQDCEVLSERAQEDYWENE